MNISHNNHVHLVGRVSSLVEPRTLPSGDEVATFRVVVPRPAKLRRGSKVTVDTFDCDAWTAALRRSVKKLTVGDDVVVIGRLRRQFSRGSGGAVSRVTVDVASVESDAGPGLGSNP